MNLCYIVIPSIIVEKMMKSTEQVEQLLRQERNQLSNNKLRKVATDMGVTRVTYKTREELIEQCVVLELYAFTH